MVPQWLTDILFLSRWTFSILPPQTCETSKVSNRPQHPPVKDYYLDPMEKNVTGYKTLCTLLLSLFYGSNQMIKNYNDDSHHYLDNAYPSNHTCSLFNQQLILDMHLDDKEIDTWCYVITIEHLLRPELFSYCVWALCGRTEVDSGRCCKHGDCWWKLSCLPREYLKHKSYNFHCWTNTLEKIVMHQ